MNSTTRLIIASLIAAAVTALPAFSQSAEAYPDSKADFQSLHLSGPRLGMSYALPGNNKVNKTLQDRNMGPSLSQFGWHFEYVVAPKTRGPAFVVEVIPFIGGVEYGLVIPSATLAMGVRLPGGFEFGMGPMGYFTGSKTTPVATSLVMAIGQNLEFNSVNIPLNLAVATSPEGTRLSFVFGYAISMQK